MSTFIPADHIHLARDKLRTIKQNSLMDLYVAEYCNIALMIGDMNEGDNLDQLVDELKHNFRVKV